MQIAGQVIADKYPQITCLYGVEHSTALVFNGWENIQTIKISYIYFSFIIYIYIYMLHCIAPCHIQ